MANDEFIDYVNGLPLDLVTSDCQVRMDLYGIKVRVPDTKKIAKVISQSGRFIGGVADAAAIIEERLAQIDAKHGVTR